MISGMCALQECTQNLVVPASNANSGRISTLTTQCLWLRLRLCCCAARRCSEHESARLKHLALKKVTRREVLERSSSELAAARIAADEARFELARHMNEVRGQWLHSMHSSLMCWLWQKQHGTLHAARQQRLFVQDSMCLAAG
jgi:hypothetical protein